MLDSRFILTNFSYLFLFFSVLFGFKGDVNSNDVQRKDQNLKKGTVNAGLSRGIELAKADLLPNDSVEIHDHEASKESIVSMEACNGNSFLKRSFSK